MRFKEMDDAYLEVLKEELFFAYPVTDENDRGLVWNGDSEATPAPGPPTARLEPQPAVARVQTDQDLSLPVEPHTPDVKRRQLTVLFIDMVGSTSLSGKPDPED